MAIKRITQLLVTAMLVIVTAPMPVFATTVLQVDTDYLLEEAALIFEGEVTSSVARWNQEQTSIITFTTFRVDEVIKGETPFPTITLGFQGGTVHDISLRVGSMVYPSVGEHGIYFIENPDQLQINPLVGWGQGHFLIRKDIYGTDRILTEGGAPVMFLDFPANNGAAGPATAQSSHLPFSHGVARGVWTGNRETALSHAMDKSSFKNALKSRLAVKKSKAASRGANGKKP